MQIAQAVEPLGVAPLIVFTSNSLMSNSQTAGNELSAAAQADPAFRKSVLKASSSAGSEPAAENEKLGAFPGNVAVMQQKP